MRSQGNAGPAYSTFNVPTALVILTAVLGCADGLMGPPERSNGPLASVAPSVDTLAADSAAASSARAKQPSHERGRLIPDQYIVLFREDTRDTRDVPGLARRIASDVGGSVLFTYERTVRGFAGRFNQAAAEALSRNPNVISVTQDAMAFTTAVQNGATWGLDRIDQRGLPLGGTYTYERSGDGVTAYIIDTGIRYDHPEFGGRATFGADFVGGNGSDCNGHGTHVAGTVGGSAFGVAKQARLVSVRVFGCSDGAPWSTIIAAMDWVGSQAARPAVVNMSLGGGKSDPINAAVAGLTSKGITVVVAAGNEGMDACFNSPASAPSAVTVGATNSSDTRAPWSNFGACLDVFAPGVGITSAWFTGGTTTISGTSMASPHVAGVAALILSELPNLSPVQVDSTIKRRATKGAVSQAFSPNWHLVYAGRDNDDRDVGSAPPTAPPSAPSGATIEWKGTYGGSAWVELRWHDNSTDETAFDIRGYRVSDGVPLWTQVSGVASTGQRSTPLYLPPGTWRVRVAALLGPVASDWSNYAEICITASLTRCENSPPPPAPAPPPADTGPTVTFTANCPGNKNRCSFDGLASSSTASIVSYNWSFGDGSSESSSNGAVTSHTYSAKGSYTVVFTVQDSKGRSASTQKTISVKSLAK